MNKHFYAALLRQELDYETEPDTPRLLLRDVCLIVWPEGSTPVERTPGDPVGPFTQALHDGFLTSSPEACTRKLLRIIERLAEANLSPGALDDGRPVLPEPPAAPPSLPPGPLVPGGLTVARVRDRVKAMLDDVAAGDWIDDVTREGADDPEIIVTTTWLDARQTFVLSIRETDPPEPA